MELSEVYKPANIKPGLISTTKSELFEELVDFLSQSEGVQNTEEIKEALWAREGMLNTVIAPSIALPHASLRRQKKTLGVFGVSQEGVDYGDREGAPVHIVMMLVDNRFETKKHLLTLRSAALLIGSPNFFSKVMRCATADEIYRIILEVEDMQRV